MRKYMKMAAAIAAAMVALASATECRAWDRKGHEAAVLLAQKHLAPQVQSRVEALLGGTMKDNAGWLDDFGRNKEVGGYTLKWHILHLDAGLAPAAVGEDDALAQIVRAADVLRHSADNPDSLVAASLRTLIYLVPEMHSVAHVQIDNVPLSKRKFSLRLSNGFTGKKAEITTVSWVKFWDKAVIFNQHGAFSAEMYADDMEICYGGSRAEFAAGGPAEWAQEMGRESKVLYEWAAPDYLMSREMRNRLEPVAYKCLARSGYRLAALLNECLK